MDLAIAEKVIILFSNLDIFMPTRPWMKVVLYYLPSINPT